MQAATPRMKEPRELIVTALCPHCESKVVILPNAHERRKMDMLGRCVECDLYWRKNWATGAWDEKPRAL